MSDTNHGVAIEVPEIETDELLEQVDDEIQREDGVIAEVNAEEKAKKIEREKHRLMVNLAEGNMKHLITKIAYLLNKYPSTRNSDITLQLKYWREFERFNGESISVTDYYQLERLPSITRARAKVQNEYGLFIASDEVRRHRKSREEKEKEAQLLTKPTHPRIKIYADESGKNDEFVIVGGLWVLDPERDRSITVHYREWRKKKEEEGVTLPKEFHFTKMNRNHLEIYKEFFTELIHLSDMISFKAVAVRKSKVKNKSIDELVYDLYYQLVHLGVEHEIKTGRITLPRQIDYVKDEEEGTDKLRLVELQQHLISRFNSYFEDTLELGGCVPMPSNLNTQIQIADLFAASVSRKLNVQNGNNHKDQFSTFVWETIKPDVINYSTTDFEQNFECEFDKDMSVVYVFD
ncbi:MULTISPECIES: DUF3800 domain-containing protein [Bacillus cereus group]|uniref:DUF3800 domain-containing protein n=1 Tax=Bacillus cereus group TaxID=86661 RepID=UPI0016714865|nr:DUF3800 domain-containing protein [Bacillus wiedmannii]MBZ4223363.1 DUF3800 domain-containing protein [Bacillus wiedmannii]